MGPSPTWFMAPMESTTSSKAGTLPPTNPVLPPWGTTASRRELQYLHRHGQRNWSLLVAGAGVSSSQFVLVLSRGVQNPGEA